MSSRTIFPGVMAAFMLFLLDTVPVFASPTPAEFLDVLSVDAIVDSMGLPPSITMNASALAMKKDGHIVLGMHSAIVELDANLNMVRHYAPEMTEAQNIGFAFCVAVTPGGTLYAEPILGAQLLRIADDTGKIEIIKANLPPFSSFSVFPDGSILSIDPVTGVAWRYARGEQLPLFPQGGDRKLFAVTNAPDGSIWGMTREGEIWAFLENGQKSYRAFPPPKAVSTDEMASQTIKPVAKPSSSLVGRWGVDAEMLKLLGRNIITFEFRSDSKLILMEGIEFEYTASSGKGSWWFPGMKASTTAFTYAIVNDVLTLDSVEGEHYVLYREIGTSSPGLVQSSNSPVDSANADDAAAITKLIQSSAAFTVYPDGSFLLAGSRLAKVSREGILQWSLPLTGVLSQGGVQAVRSCAFDPQTGIIIIADNMGRGIHRYLDTGYRKENGLADQTVEGIRIAAASGRSGTKVSAARNLALAYEEAGATLMALVEWKKLLELDPVDRSGRDRVAALANGQLKKVAETQAARTRSALEVFGLESARPLYMRAMQLYEKILATEPGDTTTRNNSEQLLALFRSSESLLKAPKSPLEIRGLQVDDIYPALIAWYASHPVGKVTLINSSGTAVEDFSISLAVAKFLDFPQEISVKRRIAPGESMDIDLYLTLNQEILDIQEDLAVSSRLSILCPVGGIDTIVSRTAALVIRRRTSIEWSDSGRLSSFITVNDPAVTNFSHLAVASHPGDEKPFAFNRILSAARIWDTLREYGIRYISDPESPLTLALNSSKVTDTVRLPVSTLLLHSGDCDDSTALYCSLLESVGIPTAIMTSPGHVFCAFDTGAAESDLWMFQAAGFEVMIDSGRLWIPVETTVLGGDFVSAVVEASRLVRKYKGGNSLEFIALAKVRGTVAAEAGGLQSGQFQG